MPARSRRRSFASSGPPGWPLLRSQVVAEGSLRDPFVTALDWIIVALTLTTAAAFLAEAPMVTGKLGVPPVMTKFTGSLKLTVKSMFCPEIYVLFAGGTTLVIVGAVVSITIAFRPAMEFGPPRGGTTMLAKLPARSVILLAE